MQTLWIVASFTVVVFIIRRAMEFRNAEKAIQ